MTNKKPLLGDIHKQTVEKLRSASNDELIAMLFFMGSSLESRVDGCPGWCNKVVCDSRDSIDFPHESCVDAIVMSVCRMFIGDGGYAVCKKD